MGGERRGGLPSLGRRGEGWVILQGILLVVLVVVGLLGVGWPKGASGWALGAGIAIGAGGAALFIGGALRLGSQLTPFPKPVEGGTVREDGPYRFVRHPIYGGVLLLSVAWSLATSPAALVPAVLLALLFEAKSRREEIWLVEHDPGYEDYRRRVRRRFIPFLW